MIGSKEHRVNVPSGELFSKTFMFGDNQQICTALYSQDPRGRLFLRVQYGCMLGTSFGSLDCDCAPQIRSAIEIISASGGILLYFRDHEALGLGIFEKAQMLHLEQSSCDGHIAALENMYKNPNRHSVLYLVPEILRDIGGGEKMVLLGSNREKYSILIDVGVRLDRMQSIDVDLSAISTFARKEVVWKGKR